MVEHITGDVVSVTSDAAIVSVGGVGLRVLMPVPDLATLKGTVTVHTVMQIRDDQPVLFGFASPRGREMFALLNSVNGVGPKLALAVISALGPDGLVRAAVTEDSAVFKSVPGVGAKTAARIVLELKDKLGGSVDDTVAVGSAVAEVRAGLIGLGYSEKEALEATADLPPDGDFQTLMRHAMKTLGSRS